MLVLLLLRLRRDLLPLLGFLALHLVVDLQKLVPVEHRALGNLLIPHDGPQEPTELGQSLQMGGQQRADREPVLLAELHLVER